ncbi:MAG: TIGR02281 family clan AA aspartic protease [Chelatococcus sp.]|nr:MAG: TIGR02281 family clan AA aspartic protease [Chelatococcus sp.]
MTQRPLIWALGAVVSVSFVAVYQVQRLAGREEMPSAASLGSPASSSRAAESASTQPPTLTVAADYSGHFIVHPGVDGFRVRMMVDTGASLVALTAADARALGLKLGPADYTMRLSTANGAVKAARVNLREVRLGGIVVRNVEAVVLPEGALGISLLGASFLGKLKGYEVQAGRMVLRG